MKFSGSNITFNVILFYLYLCNNLPVDARPNPKDPTSSSSSFVNVIHFGATGDGSTDDSKACLNAWKHVCEADEDLIFFVPPGRTYLLKPVVFKGPCKSSSIRVQVEGQILAPKSVNGWTNCKKIEGWISFEKIQGLHIIGGHFDGRGSLWWNKHEIHEKCGHSPTALRFHSCSKLRLRGSTHSNSPRNHISITNCEDVELSNLRIIAPQSSPNTDGIDISDSKNVQIHNSHIATGDDCIAINGGSSYVTIESISCGPGHGISVGSLGESREYDKVDTVHVKGCTFTNAQNGVRIKTWEGGSGYAKNIIFEDITMYNTMNPIIINQHYVDSKEKHKSKKKESAVQISDVTYRNIHGTSQSEKTISLLCSETKPCRNLKFYNVGITSRASGHASNTQIENAEVKGLS